MDILWTRLSEEVLIDNVRRHRCLWDQRDEAFKKKPFKAKAYNAITLLLRKQFPELAIILPDQVRLKFENLRTYYIREYRKTQDAPSGSADVYVSKWEHFNALSFLNDPLDIYAHPNLSSKCFPSEGNLQFVPVWSRLSEEALIQHVKKYRCLWDCRDETFNKKILKRKSYNAVSLLLREQFPELSHVSPDQVRTKYNNLRTYFLREYRKTQMAPSESGDAYTSKWELFDALLFINDSGSLQSDEEVDHKNLPDCVISLSSSAISSYDCPLLDPLPSSNSSSQDRLKTPTPLPPSLEPSLTTTVSLCPSKERKRKKEEDSTEEEVMPTVGTPYESLRQEGSVNDFSSSFGKTVEYWLRSFTPKVQRLAASRVLDLLSRIDEEYQD